MKQVLIFLCLVLSGCDNSDFADSPKTAKGETPAKYVICESAGGMCFVSARFKDLDSCERHKQWSVMLCESKPGLMVCRNDPAPLSASYCTL